MHFKLFPYNVWDVKSVIFNRQFFAALRSESQNSALLNAMGCQISLLHLAALNLDSHLQSKISPLQQTAESEIFPLHVTAETQISLLCHAADSHYFLHHVPALS
jgi:hypothetical protein